MDQDALMGHYKAAQAMGSYVSGVHGNQVINSYISGIQDESDAMLGKDKSIIEESIVDNSSFFEPKSNMASQVDYGQINVSNVDASGRENNLASGLPPTGQASNADFNSGNKRSRKHA